MTRPTALLIPLALVLAAWFCAPLLSPGVVSVEAQWGHGQDRIVWQAATPAMTVAPDQAVEPGPDGASLAVTVRFADGAQETAIFAPPAGSGRDWRRAYGSERIAVEGDPVRVSVLAPRTTALFLGLLGMLQVLFLPGRLLLRLAGLRCGPLSCLTLSFGLSLLANYFLVIFLNQLRIYTPVVVWTVAGGEIALLALLCRPDRWSPRLWFRELADRAKHALAGWDRNWRGGLAVLIWLAALAALAWHLSTVLDTAGKAFSHTDAVASWSRWAREYLTKRFIGGDFYPQLLPANLSIPYLMLGGLDLEIFSRALMPFFGLGVQVGLLHLALRSGERGYLLAMAACAWLFHTCLGDLLTAGYAEAPVAFAGFACVFALLLARLEPGDRTRYAYLAALMAALAALTKQAGLIFVPAFPVLLWFMVLRTTDDLGRTERRSLLRHCTALCWAVALPTYLIKLGLLALGKMDTNLYTLTVVTHVGRGPLIRLVHALTDLRHALGWGGLALFTAAGPVLSLIRRGPSRTLFRVLFLPFLLVYGLFFSYDIRNIALALPILALMTGLNLGGLLGRSRKPANAMGMEKKSDRGPVLVSGWLLAGLAASLLLIAGALLHRDRLLVLEERARMERMDPALNRTLYEYYRSGAMTGTILTDCYYPARLPMLAQALAVDPLDAPLSSLESLKAHLEDPRVGSILYTPERVPDAVNQWLDQTVARGDMVLTGTFLKGNAFRILAVHPSGQAAPSDNASR